MRKRMGTVGSSSALTMLLAACATSHGDNANLPRNSTLSSLEKLAEIDPRFQSYNIEMVQVTGGRFWAPYGGPNGETHRYREPVDLANPRLRALASHLSPAYLRVSGTWANTTYIAAEGEYLAEPPNGFGQVLTRRQWQGVIDFSNALGVPIITSFAASAGTRDDAGRWTTKHADRFLALTKSAGGRIHAAEFINEPSMIVPGDMPKDYNSTTYGLDFRVFAKWARQNAPEMMLLGPGNLGEKTVDPVIAAKLMAPDGAMASAALIKETGKDLDAISWHFYGGVSPRCGGGSGLSAPDAALSNEWLDRTLIEYEAMAKARNELAPGKSLWLTETAQAACGGSPWAAGFRDSFRYLNQLGTLAQKGVKVVIHNTLAASEYGLIDQNTMEPRPNYWAAVLWKKLMGSIVLEPPQTGQPTLRIFAHCRPAMNGGIGLMALNPGDTAMPLAFRGVGKIWIMQAENVDSGPVKINGRIPSLTTSGLITGIVGERFRGEFMLPSRSIAFASVDTAANSNCKN